MSTDAVMFTQLQERMGPTLAAAVIRSRERHGKLVCAADGSAVGVEAEHVHHALEAFTEAWNLITEKDAPSVAQAWFIGANPWLEDEAPVLSLRNGRYRDVVIAAKAMAGDAWF